MKSPLAYIGGKSKLAKEIVKMIPEHKTYCEVCFGGGCVFFTKDQSKFEIINDLDNDLIAFYRVVQNHLEEFLKQFKWLLTSREWFYDWKSQLESKGLTDIQRAARYYYLQRLCFGGKVKGRTFGTAVNRTPRINLLRLEEDLSEVHLRLINTVIENLSWEKFVEKYDSPDTFFYLDPPYYEKPVYKHNFNNLSDFEEMNSILKGIQGKFILSINDHPHIREVFKDFKMKQVSLKYTVGKDHSCDARELMIWNW
ncbi:MAG: DNA adenine methylase [Spirochaetes bacterium]|nr:DNA adenine methylase [Spirochaetota bacterium]